MVVFVFLGLLVLFSILALLVPFWMEALFKLPFEPEPVLILLEPVFGGFDGDFDGGFDGVPVFLAEYILWSAPIT